MIIQALDRALDVLILLSQNGKEMGISEIAREMGMHKSTIHRTLYTLEKMDLTPHTANTITDWGEFTKALSQVRSLGYALDSEELEIGLTCIGAPILNSRGTAIAAISLSGPTQRMRNGDFQGKINRIKECAAKISAAING